MSDTTEWELFWNSTSEQRYDQALSKRIDDALADNGIKVVGSYGGTDLTTGESDNALFIEGDRTQARLAVRLIIQLVPGREVTMKETTTDD